MNTILRKNYHILKTKIEDHNLLQD